MVTTILYQADLESPVPLISQKWYVLQLLVRNNIDEIIVCHQDGVKDPIVYSIETVKEFQAFLRNALAQSRKMVNDITRALI